MRTLFVAAGVAAISAAAGTATLSASLSDAEALRDGSTVTLTWSSDGPVDVLMSGDPNANPDQMTVVSDNDRDGRHRVTDLRGVTRPYFYLRPQNGEGQRVAVRLLPLEGGRNFRDLGGYPTEDGRMVKWGHVFRSGVMVGLTDGDYDYLSALGIQVVCDFRSTEERADEPTTWRAGTIDYMNWDYSTEESSGQLMKAFEDPDLTPQKMKMAMESTYYDIVEDQKDRYREMFHRLAEGDIPLAFNCSAGKDRAGTAAALILSALGVPRDYVVHDYSLSETYVDYEKDLVASAAEDDDSPYAFLAQMPIEFIRPLLRSDPDYIRNTFDYLDRTYGGPLGYIRTELQIDDMELAAIRSRLLE